MIILPQCQAQALRLAVTWSDWLAVNAVFPLPNFAKLFHAKRVKVIAVTITTQTIAMPEPMIITLWTFFKKSWNMVKHFASKP